MSDDDKCAECGEPRWEHHDFVEAPRVPKGCKCDPMDWGNPSEIPEVCGGPFKADEYECCEECSHLAECHGAA